MPGTVRLIFAMARDNNLPIAHVLGHVPRRTQAPILPALLVGVLAAGLLVLNINLPHVIETLCAVAIVWVNLAYLLVTLPMLVARLRREEPIAVSAQRGAAAIGAGTAGRLVLDGPARPADQRHRGRLGRLRGGQHRLAAHGDLRAGPLGPVRGPAGDPRLARRRAASITRFVQRRRTGRSWRSIAGVRSTTGRRSRPVGPAIEGHWIGRLAAHE